MAFMSSSSTARVTSEQHAALEVLVSDLRGIFGPRLLSLVLYGVPPTPATHDGVLRTLALLERYTFEDLRRCVPLAYGWHRRRLAVPLLLTHHEFFRTLDVFPLEYGNIIASHLVIYGEAPFEGAQVRDADRRRGCEHQAKSHLIHLREGYLETGGDARDVADLIAASAPSFRALLLSLARLESTDAADPSDQDLAGIVEHIIGVPATLVAEVLSSPAATGTVADPTALLQRYIEASEKIWNFVDRAGAES
jgi:hypothetical protein